MRALVQCGVAAAVLTAGMTGLPALGGTPLGASEAVAGDRYYRHRRHRDNFDFGDAVVGAVVVGGLIAVLSGAAKKREAENRPLESGWEPRGDWDRSNGGSGNGGDWAWADRDWANRTSEERAAVAACAREAEELGGRYEREARVREIGAVDRDGGEYRVKGTVEVRRADRDRDDRNSDDFVCYVRNDRITDFRFQTGYAAQ